MAAGGHRPGHGLLLLARVLGQRGQVQIGQQGDVVINGGITHLLELGIHRERVFLEANGVAEALAHLLNPVEAHEDRQQQPELGALVEMALQITAHGHIEFLVGAAEFHIGIDGHRVVALEQRVEEFMQGNGRAAAVALGEILFGQHLAHGGGAQQANHLGQVQISQPFAVAAHLKAAGRFKVEQGLLLGLPLAQLGQIGGRIGLHLFSGELHAGCAFAGGITNARSEIANDQHRRVARVLESPQLAEQDAVAQVDVAAGGVDAQFDAQRPALRLRSCQPCSQGLICIARVTGRKQVGHAAGQPCRQRLRLFRHGQGAGACWQWIVRARLSSQPRVGISCAQG